MAIKIITPVDAKEAFDVLTDLAIPDKNIVFRGHSSETWRLESTLARHVRNKVTMPSIQFMSDGLDHFFACLASIGKLPDRPMSPRSKLEFARHHGVPSPLIDFTHSPYVALWMAFNGVRPWEAGNVVVYALDVNGLGILWQKHSGLGDSAFSEFRWSEREEQFQHGYTVGILRYLEFPSSWNVRMLRQLGVFIYDSLQYGYHGTDFTDLEDFIEKGIDPKDASGDPTFTLRKVVIPKAAASNVFERLELMGIDGTRLYDNHEGAAADVKNAYVFNRKTGFAHDIVVREPANRA
jgi:FRG domain